MSAHAKYITTDNMLKINTFYEKTIKKYFETKF